MRMQLLCQVSRSPVAAGRHHFGGPNGANLAAANRHALPRATVAPMTVCEP